MRKFFLTILALLAGAYAFFGLLAMLGALDTAGTDPAGRGMSAAFGMIGLIIGAAAGAVLFFGRKSLVALVLAALILGAIPALFGLWTISLSRSEARAQKETQESESGRADFGHDPALFAVADAIARNDPDAVRTAAKGVPNLQQPGRDGMTLLNFAVKKCWSRPEFSKSARALLDSGADPNFTNESRESFAMANSIHGPVALLWMMLQAGGNANAVDELGRPMIFGNWQLEYNEKDRRARLELLAGRGLDLNATLPVEQHTFSGYPLLLYRTNVGRGDHEAYNDAMFLIERGADPNRAAPDGTTLLTMLTDHMQFFSQRETGAPEQFLVLFRFLEQRALPTPAQ